MLQPTLARILFAPISLYLSFRAVWSPPADVLSLKMDRFIDSVIEEWHSVGLGVAVVRLDGHGIWRVETRGYGKATEAGDAMTDESLWPLASNSKLFTATSTGMLVCNASLPNVTWVSKLQDILPFFKLQDPIASAKTNIFDLLSHRTGLPLHGMVEEPDYTAEDVVARMQHLKPSLEFREGRQYMDLGYTILSTLPLALTNRSFTSFVHEEIFNPLGMTQSTYSMKDARASGKMCDGFLRTGKFDESDHFVFADPFSPRTYRVTDKVLTDSNGGIPLALAGATGIISSMKDIAIWLQTLLLDGKHPVSGEVIIPEGVLETLATGISISLGKAIWPESSPVVYGGAQMRYSYRGHEVIGHIGEVQGFMSHITRFPDDKFGVAVFSNEENYGTQVLNVVLWKIIDHVLGLEPIDWNERMKTQAKMMLASQPKATPRPANPSPPSKPLSSLAGTYYNPAYGKYELCLFAPNTTVIPSCAALAQRMKVEIPTLLEPEMPTFITSLTKVNANYARFTHFDGDMFNASYLKSVPSTTEPGTYWVKDVTDGAVDLGLLESFDLGLEFFVEDGEVGFSLSGIWGARGVGRLTGATGKERAEVWFTKVAEARSTYPDGSVWPVASFPSRQGRAPYYPWWSPPHH